MKSFISMILMFLSLVTFAQNNATKGIIAGKIIDQKTGEELTGAQISVENTMLGAASDIEGNFQIKNILPGTYNILCRSLGYSPKRIEKVTVKAGEVTALNISMEEPISKDIKEVVITATLDKEKSTTLLTIQKNSATLSDGVSAESIKKTP